MLARILISGLALSAVSVAQFPDPVALTGNNTFVHDPNVIKKDSTYYRFSTFGQIQIASALAMTGPWTELGHAIDGGSIINIPGNTVLWAPDVSLVNGTYYMYYSVSVGGSQNSEIGVATSSELTPGSWTDHGSIGIPKSSAYNKIDPNLIISDNGDPLLTFGSYWHDLYQVQLSRPPLTIQSNAAPKNIEYNGTARAPTSASPGTNQAPQVMEGSYQFTYEVNGTQYWYLFWSSGDCCSVPPNLPATGDEYKVMVGRSTSPTGPWVDDRGIDSLDAGGRLVLGSHGDHVFAPGGQGVMIDNEAPLMYYHYVDPTVGYGVYDFQFGWNWLDFSSGWPVVVANPVKQAPKDAVGGLPTNATATNSAVRTMVVRDGQAIWGTIAMIAWMMCTAF